MIPTKMERFNEKKRQRKGNESTKETHQQSKATGSSTTTLDSIKDQRVKLLLKLAE
jgi:hypothetical protein